MMSRTTAGKTFLGKNSSIFCFKLSENGRVKNLSINILSHSRGQRGFKMHFTYFIHERFVANDIATSEFP